MREQSLRSKGPDKFLHGQKLARFHLAFTRDRRNWTNICTAKCASLGSAFFRSQTCTLSRSKIRPVPPVPCKRKVPGTVQVFIRAKICPDPCKRGLSRSKIRPVPPVPCKRKMEPYIHAYIHTSPLFYLGFTRVAKDS